MANAVVSVVRDRVRFAWEKVFSREQTRQRIRRIAKWILITFFSVWCLYIAVINIVLHTDWARHVASSNPQRAQVTFASAWSIFPMTFHVFGVHLFGQFTGTQYEVQCDSAIVNAAIFPLLSHHVVAKKIVSSGVLFHRVTPDQPSPDAPTVTPPVPFDPSQAPPIILFDESLSRWTISVRDLTVNDLTEVWSDDIRFTGSTNLVGSLEITPNRSFAVTQLTFAIAQNILTFKKDVVLNPIHADGKMELTSIDPRTASMKDALRNMVTNLSLNGTTGDLKFIGDMAGSMPVGIGGQGARITADLSLDHGSFVAPGSLRLRIDQFDLTAGHVAIGATGDVTIDVIEEAGRNVATSKANLMATLRDPKMQSFADAALTGHAHLAPLDITHTEDMVVSFEAHAPTIKVPNVAKLNSLLSAEGIQMDRGAVAARVDLAMVEPVGSMNGDVTLQSNDISGSWSNLHFAGKMAANTHVTRESSTSDFVLTHSALNLDDGALSLENARTNGWWGHVEMPSARIRTGQPGAAGSLHATFRDIDPVLTAMASLHGLPSALAQMAHAGPWTVDAHGAVGKNIALDMLDARARVEGILGHPDARVRASYYDTNQVQHVRAVISLGILALGFEKKGDAVSVQLDHPNDWFDGKHP